MQGRAIAKLFSATTFRALGAPDGIGALRRYVAGTPFAAHAKGRRVGAVLDSAYNLLAAEYRNEYFYKNEITKKILLGRHSLTTSRLLTEFGVGDVKADLAIINGTSSVYEIKTEYDDLVRLPKQLRGYGQLFDRTYVVTSEGLSVAVLDKLPASVGLIVLTSRSRLSIRREAASNIPNIQTRTVYKALRMGEIRHICKGLGTTLDGPNSTWHAQAWACFQQLTPAEAHQAMVAVLRQRPIHKRQLDFIDSVPHSLKHLSIAKVVPIGSYEPIASRLRETF